MKRILLLLLIIISVDVFSQTKISGFVYDSTTGESLIGANIYGKESGTSTNGYGYFSIITHEKILNVSYVGYKSEVIDVSGQGIIKVHLSSSGKLNEVVVTDKIDKRGELNSFELKANTIASLPTILGEPDIFKAIQLLPGVSMGNDGGADFYVRGGSRDQNLIMIDDVPIYNHMHGMGYFSAINNEVVKDVKLYKGAFPARFGGRTSSVLDIKTREGNTKELNASISISPFIFQSTLEIPVVKNTSALLLSYRNTTFDLVSKLAVPDMPTYGFYDTNIKYHHKLGDKDVVFAGFYLGADKFETEFSEDDVTNGEKSRYGNLVASLRWNHIFNNSIFINTTFAYNNYDFYHSSYADSKITEGGVTYDNSFNITFGSIADSYRIKSDLDYKLNNKHSLQFGTSVVAQRYNPYNIYEVSDSRISSAASDTVSLKIFNLISRIYLEDQMNFGNLRVNVGSNFSMTNTGNENFFVLEPRLSTVYSLTKNVKLSASYSRMSQNIHLVTQTGPLLPEDLWYPSTDSIPPVISNQLTTGINYKNKNINIAVEGFYKHMQNITEKRFTPRGESALNLIEIGTGKSYGIETMLAIDVERLMFNINYTYSRSLRNFENLNFGDEFPFMYDRPHDLKVFAVYKLSKRWKISTVVTYKSGNTTTLKQGAVTGAYYYVDPFITHPKYYDEDYVAPVDYINYYGGRNSYRLPSYFRWDLDLSRTHKGDWGTYILKFGVYNVTNHHNAYKLKVSGDKIVSEGLIPIMPYISYSWRLR